MAAGEEEAVGPGAGYDAEKVREFFDQFDNDGSGNVSPEEFKELCQAMQPDMPDEDVAAALEQLDSDGDGEISFDGVCNHKIPFSSSMDLLLVHSLSGLFASVFECPLLVASGGQRTAIGGGDRAARFVGQRTTHLPSARSVPPQHHRLRLAICADGNHVVRWVPAHVVRGEALGEPERRPPGGHQLPALHLPDAPDECTKNEGSHTICRPTIGQRVHFAVFRA